MGGFRGRFRLRHASYSDVWLTRRRSGSAAGVAMVLLATLHIAGVIVAAAGETRHFVQHPPSHSSQRAPAASGAGEQRDGHAHVDVPAPYAQQAVPAGMWTDSSALARGKKIYDEKCAVCHGESGDGRGPATATLAVKPPDMRDARMMAEMRSAYWFWRVSEGGFVEPFRSKGSVMPAWKDALSVDERWAVIAYEHAFSGHNGPHGEAEHPEMRMDMHGDGGASTGADKPAHKH